MNDMHSHDMASESLITRLNDAMLRLQRSNPDRGRLEAIQQPAMPVVRSSLDTTNKAATDTQGAGNTTDDFGIGTGGRQWITRGADSGAGGGKGNGSAAGGSEA